MPIVGARRRLSGCRVATSTADHAHLPKLLAVQQFGRGDGVGDALGVLAGQATQEIEYGFLGLDQVVAEVSASHRARVDVLRLVPVTRA